MKLNQGNLKQHNSSQGRWYTKDDGDTKYYSVTTILKWSENQWARKRLKTWNDDNVVISRINTKRGNVLHDLLKQVAEYQFQKLTEVEYKAWLVAQLTLAADGTDETDHALKQVYILMIKVLPLLRKIEIIATEFKLYHPKLYYAGTGDALCLWNGLLVLLDWKTSETPKKALYDYPLQLVAYIQAYNELYGAEFGYCSAGVIVNIPIEGQLKIHFYDADKLNKVWLVFKERLNKFFKAKNQRQLINEL